MPDHVSRDLRQQEQKERSGEAMEELFDRLHSINDLIEEENQRHEDEVAALQEIKEDIQQQIDEYADVVE